MNENLVYTFAKWVVKEGQLNTVLSLLAEVVKKSRVEKGNVFYRVHQSNSDANVLILFECYTDNLAINDHRNSSYFQEIVLGKIIPLLENREVALVSELDLS